MTFIFSDCDLDNAAAAAAVAVIIPDTEPELIALNGEEFPWDDIRLPKFIKPIRYDIELEPNLTSKIVKGIEKLIFKVRTSARRCLPTYLLAAVLLLYLRNPRQF